MLTNTKTMSNKQKDTDIHHFCQIKYMETETLKKLMKICSSGVNIHKHISASLYGPGAAATFPYSFSHRCSL